MRTNNIMYQTTEILRPQGKATKAKPHNNNRETKKTEELPNVDTKNIGEAEADKWNIKERHNSSKL